MNYEPSVSERRPDRGDGRGRIVDVGTHADLVSRPGVYQNLYNGQYRSAHERGLETLFA